MKRKLSKRGKLYLANIIAFVILIAFLILEWATLGKPPNETLLKYVLIQCLFTFLSLIVYYLSIVADALNKRYAEQEKKSKE